jgi:hypothetical protein
MVSPDGRYIWNGSQWLPIADPSMPAGPPVALGPPASAAPPDTTSHQGIFPNWNGIKVDAPAPVAMAPFPVQMARPAPAVTYGMNPIEAAKPSQPPWYIQPTGLSKYLYYGAILVVVVIVALLIRAYVPSIPWFGSSTDYTPSPSPSPPQLTQRSEYLRADAYIKNVVTPTIGQLNDTIRTQHETCNGTLTVSCLGAITENDNQFKSTLVALDHANAPECLAPYALKLRTDLITADGTLQQAFLGYKQNRKAAVAQSLSRFAVAIKPLAANIKALTTAQQTRCDGALVGP